MLFLARKSDAVGCSYEPYLPFGLNHLASVSQVGGASLAHRLDAHSG